jgi:hypothetical protein
LRGGEWKMGAKNRIFDSASRRYSSCSRHPALFWWGILTQNEKI